MFRTFLLLASGLLASQAAAQTPPATAARGTECIVRMDAAPTSWMIQGYDPYGGSTPAATFGVTFTNEGGGECRFTPTFELDQPPFGLSKGPGKKIGYALLNLTDTLDVTPRAGQSVRTTGQRLVVLPTSESITLLYKLIADPNDVSDAGTFTQNVTLEARDSSLRSLGGTRVVLGIDVLPAARIGLAGAYTTSEGHAVVDLGELRQGVAPVPLQLRVSSTGQYDLNVSSANSGRLRLGSSDWYVPYSIAIGSKAINLAAGGTITGPASVAAGREALPIQFIIGETSNLRAGTYSDVISISVTAR